MRPHYRMASHGVHANPKSITFTPDLPEAEHGLALLTGASPAGLADPGHGTLISLTQVTATVLASKGGEATGLVIGTMLQLTDEAGHAYLEAHQTLELRRASEQSSSGPARSGRAVASGTVTPARRLSDVGFLNTNVHRESGPPPRAGRAR
jgi:hypothetical protein